ncbi:hypothetical protein [Sphingobacterium lactis]|uniref:Lipocalin-like domain-containing protein n=1 Tax=Sphingobacterium lactis TaxID=797291 RepID=A0A1H5WN83_9SPHI|nr:hypothetical protein [Sphingobacterium lactis]SEG01059.1 hypothetical protein SAMN05421877_104116 [Sphingobacterium lactis]
MKTKLLLMLLPIMLLFAGSCSGLLDDLIEEAEGEYDEKRAEVQILGKWNAYEYYSNDFYQEGVSNPKDFSGVNQIGVLLKYESRSGSCSTKMEQFEQRLDHFKLEFRVSDKVILETKDYFKATTYDNECTARTDTDGGVDKEELPYRLDAANGMLYLTEDEDTNYEVGFQILNLTDDNLHIRYDSNGEFIDIKLRR